MSRNFKNNIHKVLIRMAAIITVLCLVTIVGFITSKGLPYINFDFIFNIYSVSDPNSGILPMLVGTIYIVIVTLVIAIPISLLSAIYLHEYAKKNRIQGILHFAIDGLVSIPSIVYGLFGFSLFVVTLKSFTGGYSIVSGSLTLSIMILPILIKAQIETLKTIPNSLREASYALGASKRQTIFKVILPTALGGIINAIILSMGRVVSESAPILMTAGMVYLMPTSIFKSSRTLTTHLYYLASEGTSDTQRNQAYATATILILVIVFLNAIARTISKRIEKKRGIHGYN